MKKITGSETERLVALGGTIDGVNIITSAVTKIEKKIREAGEKLYLESEDRLAVIGYSLPEFAKLKEARELLNSIKISS
jgi:hypothetical protein